jgi:pimeloyl-ACP methyl ester carboxylesterase
MSDLIPIDVPGGELAVFRLGAQRPDAPQVLAIHGITSTSRTWLAPARALGDRAALMAVDLRGRGRSGELPPPFGLDAHVRDMVAVLDRLGLDRPVVTGHSLGAYVAVRLATTHPDRVRSLVLVDGGLTIPRTDDKDPEEAIQSFLGPTVERLKMTFPDVGAYRDWWAQHPAVAGADIAPEDLDEYAAHDLVGEPPQLRSSVNPQVVRDDGLDLYGPPDADRLTRPAVLLSAPRGMVNDENPMQPLEVVQRWVDGDPQQRRGLQVPDVNHYSIAWGAHGARAVADEIARAVADTEPR